MNSETKKENNNLEEIDEEINIDDILSNDDCYINFITEKRNKFIEELICSEFEIINEQINF
jgi:hypothetical protein